MEQKDAAPNGGYITTSPCSAVVPISPAAVLLIKGIITAIAAARIRK